MSFANQDTQQRFPFGYDAVFTSLLTVLPPLGFRVQSSDAVIGRVSVSAGSSLFSWGENVTIILQRAGDEHTDVHIQSSLKVGSNILAASKHHQHFERIIAALSKHLQTPSGGSDQGSRPTSRFKTRADYERWKAGQTGR